MSAVFRRWLSGGAAFLCAAGLAGVPAPTAARQITIGAHHDAGYLPDVLFEVFTLNSVGAEKIICSRMSDAYEGKATLDVPDDLDKGLLRASLAGETLQLRTRGSSKPGQLSIAVPEQSVDLEADGLSSPAPGDERRQLAILLRSGSVGHAQFPAGVNIHLKPIGSGTTFPEAVPASDGSGYVLFSVRRSASGKATLSPALEGYSTPKDLAISIAGTDALLSFNHLVSFTKEESSTKVLYVVNASQASPERLLGDAVRAVSGMVEREEGATANCGVIVWTPNGPTDLLRFGDALTNASRRAVESRLRELESVGSSFQANEMSKLARAVQDRAGGATVDVVLIMPQEVSYLREMEPTEDAQLKEGIGALNSAHMRLHVIELTRQTHRPSRPLQGIADATGGTYHLLVETDDKQKTAILPLLESLAVR